MARDLSDPWAKIRALEERVRVLETATPLQDSSVTRGRLRVASADGFVAEAVAGGAPAVRVTGLQVVDGVLRVTGTLEGSGSWSWTGPWTLSGNGTISGNVTATGTLTQNGPWNMNGAGTIAGNVTQTGNTSQQGNVNVTGGGKITVGTMVMNPAISGGAITFGNGAQVFTDASTIQVYKGNGVVQVSDTEAKVQVGGTAVRVLSGQIFATGMATKAVGTVPGGFVGAIVYDAGEMKRLI